MLTRHKFNLPSPNHVPLMQFGPGPAETSMRLRSHLIRKHVLEFDSRRALMCRSRFFQVLTPEFGHSTRVWRPCTRALNGTRLLELPVSETQNYLCRCPGACAREPSVNTA